jgi:hypothetical protein
MPKHFREFGRTASSPGVILLREAISIGTAIDEIVLIWTASAPEEWVDRIVWIPL